MGEFLNYIKLLPLLYLIVINLAGIIVCFRDKRKAIRGQWRIPEKTIFLIALIGGSIGVLIGMYAFRHKTKHMSFVIGIPVILMAQIALVLFVLVRFVWGR